MSAVEASSSKDRRLATNAERGRLYFLSTRSKPARTNAAATKSTSFTGLSSRLTPAYDALPTNRAIRLPALAEDAKATQASSAMTNRPLDRHFIGQTPIAKRIAQLAQSATSGESEMEAHRL